MSLTRLDHIVVGAATLDQGADFIRKELGVEMEPGGEHESMGTHNRLLRLGEQTYLEIIAVNPEARPPSRPRVFALDDPFVRACLHRQPRLLTWVVSTTEIETLAARSAVPCGALEPMRRGDLQWRITIPEDGSLPGAGFLPTLIQWPPDIHPSKNMQDRGCTLTKLALHHPRAAWLQSALEAIAAVEHVEIHPLPDNAIPYLKASIRTPLGKKTLTSHFPAAAPSA